MKRRKRIKIMLPAVFAVMIFSCNQAGEKIETRDPVDTVSEKLSKSPVNPIDKNILNGNWKRSDADYRIEISGVMDGGSMKAGYYNPKSINVSRANWAYTDGLLRVFIELRDENYPGSTYDLYYFPGTGLLAGKYFQAMEGLTFDVEFTRQK